MSSSRRYASSGWSMSGVRTFLITFWNVSFFGCSKSTAAVNPFTPPPIERRLNHVHEKWATWIESELHAIPRRMINDLRPAGILRGCKIHLNQRLRESNRPNPSRQFILRIWRIEPQSERANLRTVLPLNRRNNLLRQQNWLDDWHRSKHFKVWSGSKILQFIT